MRAGCLHTWTVGGVLFYLMGIRWGVRRFCWCVGMVMDRVCGLRQPSCRHCAWLCGSLPLPPHTTHLLEHSPPAASLWAEAAREAALTPLVPSFHLHLRRSHLSPAACSLRHSPPVCTGRGGRAFSRTRLAHIPRVSSFPLPPPTTLPTLPYRCTRRLRREPLNAFVGGDPPVCVHHTLPL